MPIVRIGEALPNCGRIEQRIEGKGEGFDVADVPALQFLTDEAHQGIGSTVGLTDGPQSGFQIDTIGVVVITYDDKPIIGNTPCLEFNGNALIEIALAFMLDAKEMLVLDPAGKKAWQQPLQQGLHGRLFEQKDDATFH